MKHRLHRGIAAMLSLMLLICGLSYAPPLSAAAAETEIPVLRDAMTSVMGDDFIVGTVINGGNVTDSQAMQLATTHFNAITLENELKPESLLGASWSRPQTETVTLNGKSLVVPKLNFSNPERILNYICDWNQKHPDQIIRIRGHVLIWHSQTPDWFFHEDYDASKPFVDAATMSLREEWFIKSVAEHFTGEGSKYRDLFYAWDVVNEAVSDGTGTYRSDSDNPASPWWKIFKSNKFITDAFVFANKYMPKSVQLYYNDYNEFMWIKPDGIVKLLKDVKNTPGARIDGMGMQGHYSTNDGWPTIDDFKKAVRSYCAVVGQVQLTELDLAVSDAYDGSAQSEAAEHERTAARYKAIYAAIRELNKEGCKVTGLTVWGITDKYSWLQSANSAGGGSDGTKKQFPLLFDRNYQPKKAFYALTEPAGITHYQADITASGNGGAVITGALISKAKQAAGGKDIPMTLTVKAGTSVKYTLKANTGDLAPGASLKLYRTGAQTDEYLLVDAKTYKVSAAGDVTVYADKNATYVLVTAERAAQINAQIKKTIVPKASSITMNKGTTTAFELGSEANTENIKSITYTSTKPSVAAVGKKGKITAKKAGTATISAKVKLKNGTSKTIKMKVRVL